MFFSKITSFFFACLFSVSSVFSFIPSSIWFKKNKYYVEDSESIVFNAALISDIHSQSAYSDDASKTIRKAICGISRTDSVPDVLVIAGDISNASDPKEYRMLEWSLSSFNKIPYIVPATGNHDVRARDSYAEAVGNFYDFADFCGVKIDKPYFNLSVKGYSFIILGSENRRTFEPELSDEQVAWFENSLVEALKTKKPIFIVCHQALYNSNNVIYNPEEAKNWGIGNKSSEIENIIRKYVPDYEFPVFFISGHVHRKFNENTVDLNFCENLCCISLPSILKTKTGGLGMSLEIYPKKAVLKARNYLTMECMSEYCYEIPIG